MMVCSSALEPPPVRIESSADAASCTLMIALRHAIDLPFSRSAVIGSTSQVITLRSGAVLAVRPAGDRLVDLRNWSVHPLTSPCVSSWEMAGLIVDER